MRLILLEKDGLGNQLFQYAAAIYYARQMGASVEVIPCPARFANSHGHPRPFLLSHFRITAPVRERTPLDRLMTNDSPRFRWLGRAIRWATRSTVYGQPGSQTWTFLEKLPKSRAERNYLKGNFQAHQYVDAVEPQLRAEFQFREPATGYNQEMLTQIRREVEPVSVHVRAGDYKVDSRGELLLPPDYYARAMNAARARLPGARFFLFSDDFPFVQAHLRLAEDVVMVDQNREFEAHEDLRLMAACRHHILSNSTLSWWGAWLNASPTKMVFAPAHWRNRLNEIEGSDIVAPGWISIANDDVKSADMGAIPQEVPY